MSRETYLRVVLHRDGVELIAGLELRPDDAMGTLRTVIKTRMTNACAKTSPGKWRDCAEAIVKSIELHWPDRAYFIEVGDDRNGWVQVFDPKGYVRRNG